jgi:pro-apoptotic serine protease NMA111
VRVEAERGGRAVVADVRVQDLHAVTPSCFLEVAAASLHGLSYQQARNNSFAVGAVYVAEPGYLLGQAQARRANSEKA